METIFTHHVNDPRFHEPNVDSQNCIFCGTEMRGDFCPQCEMYFHSSDDSMAIVTDKQYTVQFLKIVDGLVKSSKSFKIKDCIKIAPMKVAWFVGKENIFLKCIDLSNLEEIAYIELSDLLNDIEEIEDEDLFQFLTQFV